MGAYNDHAGGPQEQQQGGIGYCAGYRCPCKGTINLGGEEWFCRHHARRPRDVAEVVSECLLKNGLLLREIMAGYKTIADPKELTNDELRGLAFKQAETLVVARYEAPLDFLDEKEGVEKCWPNDYRRFVLGLDSLLSKLVADAITAHRSAA